MSTFDTTLHPRGQAANAGQFRQKENAAPDAALDSGAQAHAERVEQLEQEFFDLWADTSSLPTIDQAGETAHRQALLAASTDNPAVLARLARNTIGEVDLAVARNPHTPAAVLHHIACDSGRDRDYAPRVVAMRRRSCDEATIRELWQRQDDGDQFARAMRMDMATAPNTPGDILEPLTFRTYSSIAGSHPGLPDGALARGISAPDTMHLVVGNPKLTDRQLSAAVALARGVVGGGVNEDDDDSVWGALTAAGIARHPNASEETVRALLTFPDAHVQKTAKDRLTGNRIIRSRAAAEQEMRDAGGSHDEIKQAGDIAARRALNGHEWGTAAPEPGNQ